MSNDYDDWEWDRQRRHYDLDGRPRFRHGGADWVNPDGQCRTKGEFLNWNRYAIREERHGTADEPGDVAP